VSPRYPFKEESTLKPSQAIALDANDVVVAGFTVDPSPLELTTSFINDLKIILSNEFRDPFLSRIVMRERVDPATTLVRVFVDLEFSARYTRDNLDHVVLTLTDKAYHDVQDNTAPSSRDGLSLDLTMVQVDGRDWLNSGVVQFGFIGSVQSSLPTSWSVGSLTTGAKVEGFASVPALKTLAFPFTRPAAALTELAYTRLGDLQTAVPFLSKILYYPFDASATAAVVLNKYVRDLEITGPAFTRVFIKRIRRTTLLGSPVFTFLFAYNERDSSGNYLATVNLGVATVTATSGSRVRITSVGSNRKGGVTPTWLDEVAGETTDNLGVGALTVSSWADLPLLFDELLAVPVLVGSPSPILVSPVEPVHVVGVVASEDAIEMIEENGILDSLAVDIQGKLEQVTERVLGAAHLTRNVKVTVGGVLVNRRTSYGSEEIMRDFFGIPSTESLIDNPKITLDDEWFDTTKGILNRYQHVQGHNRWRNQ
jgi:hypothetical protein